MWAVNDSGNTPLREFLRKRRRKGEGLTGVDAFFGACRLGDPER